jgi:hypothetical protein
VDLTQVVRELWRLRLAVVGVIALAVFAALLVAYKVSLMPPSLETKSYEFGSAATEMLVDTERSPLADVRPEFDPLATRASVYARLMTTARVKEYIAREVGVPSAQIVAEGPPSGDVTRAEREPLPSERSNQLRGEEQQFRLSMRSEPELPVVTIASQGPTAKAAVELANGAVSGFKKYLADIQDGSAIVERARVEVKQLGEAKGGTVNAGVNRTLPMLAFVATLGLGLMLLIVISNLSRGWSSAATADAAPMPTGGLSLDADGDNSLTLPSQVGDISKRRRSLKSL